MTSGAADSGPDREWVTVAILGRARGIHGEIAAFSLSKPERYASLREVFLFPEGSRREVESAWFHDNRLILKFRGVDTMSDAERLAGCEVRVPRAERMPLDRGEYFESDLIGCEVIERDGGASLGRAGSDILQGVCVCVCVCACLGVSERVYLGWPTASADHRAALKSGRDRSRPGAPGRNS